MTVYKIADQARDATTVKRLYGDPYEKNKRWRSSRLRRHKVAVAPVMVGTVTKGRGAATEPARYRWALA